MAKKKKKHEGDVVSPCLFNLCVLVYQRGIKYFLILGLFESQDSSKCVDICYQMESAIIIVMVNPIDEMIYV